MKSSPEGLEHRQTGLSELIQKIRGKGQKQGEKGMKQPSPEYPPGPVRPMGMRGTWNGGVFATILGRGEN